MPCSIETTTLSLNLSHSTNTPISWSLRTKSFRENSTHSLRLMMLSEETWTERIRSPKSDSKLMRSFTSPSLISNRDHQGETDHLLSMRFNSHPATKSTLLQAPFLSQSNRKLREIRLNSSNKHHTTDTRETRSQTT